MSDGNKIANELSLARGTVFGFLGTAFGLGIGLLTNILLARGLAPQGYGTWTLGLLIVNLLTTISVFGLNQGVAKFIGQYRGEGNEQKISHVIRAGILITTLLGTSLCLLVFAFSPAISGFFDVPRLTDALRLLVLAVVPSSLLTVFYSVYRGYENIRINLILRDLGGKALWGGVVLVSVYFLAIDSPAGIGNAYLATQVSLLLIVVAWFFRSDLRSVLNVGSDRIVSRNIVGELLFFSAPVLITGISTFVAQQSDKFVIGYFLSAASVGTYNVAFKIAYLSTFVFDAVGRIFMPVLSRVSNSDDPDQGLDLYFRATKWGAMFTTPVAITLVAFPDLFLWVFGSEYSTGATALRILILSNLLGVLWGPNGALLTAFGETKFVSVYTVIVAVLNLSLNLVLVPAFGLAGAGVASAVSMLVGDVIATMKIHRTLSLNVYNLKYVLFAIVSTSSLAAVWGADLLRVSTVFVYVVVFLVEVVIGFWLLLDRIDIDISRKLLSELRDVVG